MSKLPDFPSAIGSPITEDDIANYLANTQIFLSVTPSCWLQCN